MKEKSLDPLLLEILVCPLTHAPLHYDREANELISFKAGLAYPIEEGVPVMLPAQARKLTKAEQEQKGKKPPPP